MSTKTDDPVQEAVARIQNAVGEVPCVVACSGGLDSMVLLHACSQVIGQVQVVHVNHHLQTAASDFETRCRAVTNLWGLNLTVLHLTPPNPLGSLETWAREARYEAQFEWMQNKGFTHLWLAHHQDDQVETSLLQLFRGSGLRGIAGMSPIASAGVARNVHPRIRLCRPFLTLTKAQLRHYAQTHAINYIEDPSNSQADVRRNWLRLRLLPEIVAQYPQAPHGISRLANFMGEVHDTLDSMARSLLVQMTDANTLNLRAWRQLEGPAQTETLRLWLSEGGVRCGRDKLLELCAQLNKEAGGIRQVAGHWQVHVRQGRATLHTETTSP